MYKKILFIIVILFCTVFVYAQEEIEFGDITEYWVYSGDVVTFAWTPIGGELFKVKIVWVENSVDYFDADVVEPYIDIMLPRTGHFDFYCRACSYTSQANLVPVLAKNGVDTVYCTEWAVSTDATHAVIKDKDNNEISGGWRVYAIIAPPGPPIIN